MTTRRFILSALLIFGSLSALLLSLAYMPGCTPPAAAITPAEKLAREHASRRRGTVHASSTQPVLVPHVILPPPPPPKMPPVIGVWYQPAESFAKWRGRGINTLIGYESEGGTVSVSQWRTAAAMAGLNYICQPSDNLAADAADPHLLAWINQPDEPDGGGATTPAAMLANYARLKAAGPDKPVLINFDSWQIKWKSQTGIYQQYVRACDWMAVDLYVANGGFLQSVADYGARIDFLRSIAPGKPIIGFIECSDQKLKDADWTQKSYVDAGGSITGVAGPGTVTVASRMRAPTPAEEQAQIDVVLGHGGWIAYFPDIVGAGWLGFDGTTPELEGVMKAANARLVQ